MKFFLSIPLSVVFLFSLSSSVLAQTLPGDFLELQKPQAFVNDFADVLSQEYEDKLEEELRVFEAETGNEAVVVTVPSLQGTTIDDFSVRLFESWKIGKKDLDNGFLFILAPTERQARFEVGYGLESYLTDSMAGTILRSRAFPAFQSENYEDGIDASIKSAISIITAKGGVEFQGADENVPNAENASMLFFNPLSFFLFFSFISYLAGFFGRSKHIWPGGLAGGILGGIIGSIFFWWIGIIIGFFGLGLLGLFFDYIVSKNYAYRKAHGLPTDFKHSMGGFWFGGGRGGFGGGGFGGFGGFGGGRSGGGGASGGW